MRWLLPLVVGLVVVPVVSAQRPPVQLTASTELVFSYRAHDGRRRPAWLVLPADYDGGPIPLVIAPHDRDVTARTIAALWGDLPGEGNFAVICPGGQGRRLRLDSWGYPGQIADLARMPAIAAAHGVNVDLRRIYAVGGSMGGQETLLLDARYPHLLAGAVAFDPATDMRDRYYDFARLPGGRELQALARIEVGGTPRQVPKAYARRSPDHYIPELAFSGVPLQLYWSRGDRVIVDQLAETGALAEQLQDDNPRARLWDFEGDWSHTAEMRANRRLPRALARFGLLPRADIPPLPGIVLPGLKSRLAR